MNFDACQQKIGLKTSFRQQKYAKKAIGQQKIENNIVDLSTITRVWQAKETKLLSDTEIRKNISQQFIIGHLAGDHSKMVQRLADVNGHQV